MGACEQKGALVLFAYLNILLFLSHPFTIPFVLQILPWAAYQKGSA